MIESSYLFSLVLGSVVLAFSIFAGGESDKDLDGDFDVEVGEIIGIDV